MVSWAPRPRFLEERGRGAHATWARVRFSIRCTYVIHHYRARCAPGLPIAQLFSREPAQPLRIEEKNSFAEPFFKFGGAARGPEARVSGLPFNLRTHISI